MIDNEFSTASSLIDYLGRGQASDFPPANEKKPYIDRVKDLYRYFSEFPVEMGAMKNEIDQWKTKLKGELQEAFNLEDEEERRNKIDKLFDEDAVIFLNKHGPDHIDKVSEKALEILKCFSRTELSFYEVFLLLCSIYVHDIGNFFGRANHEKRISSMLDEACKNIIDDSIERRVISRIAGVHGGRINNNKDTISVLKVRDKVNNMLVREQLLAAVLRLADELADDSTRAVDPALKAGILGDASEIFHVYSSKLHTVMLEQNPVNEIWEIVLKYEFDEETAKKQFQKGKNKVFLLDEIYERTFKMEQERRYCMRFLRRFCSIEIINVEITIEKEESVFDQEEIKYSLTEKGYPDKPFNSIKDVKETLLTGAEMAERLCYKS